jgi:lipopolysaccharide biosynthesis regulator YciM
LDVSLKKKRKFLNSLQEKARQNPQDCRVQVRLGNLLTKMGQKEAAIEVYHHAAEKFAQKGFIIEATAMSKIIMRRDPPQREIQQKISKLYTEWEALKGKKSTLEMDPETNRSFGEDIWLRKEKVTQ